MNAVIQDRINLIDKECASSHLYYSKNTWLARDPYVNFYVPLLFMILGIMMSVFSYLNIEWFVLKWMNSGLFVCCVTPMILRMHGFQVERILMKHKNKLLKFSNIDHGTFENESMKEQLKCIIHASNKVVYYLPLIILAVIAMVFHMAELEQWAHFDIVTANIWLAYLIYFFSSFSKLKKLNRKFETALLMYE